MHKSSTFRSYIILFYRREIAVIRDCNRDPSLVYYKRELQMFLEICPAKDEKWKEKTIRAEYNVTLRYVWPYGHVRIILRRSSVSVLTRKQSKVVKILSKYFSLNSKQ